MQKQINKLIADFREGKITAAARLISIIEGGGEEAEEAMDAVFPRVNGVLRVGFTGPPGAGKSTIVYNLTLHYRARGEEVGIIAVDPTSPFSGGALLGDRIRMQKLSSDSGVFLRSLASRGSLGGISNCTDDVADLMDAFGKDIVLIETVGVGQSELEVADKAHTVVVVLVPESGDGIQAMKAGLMEIGDIFVMNKSDHPDAEIAARELEEVLRMKEVGDEGWKPPVILTSAVKNEGTEKLLESIDEHEKFLRDQCKFEEKRKKILYSRVRSAFIDRIEKKFLSDPQVEEIMNREMKEVYRGKLSPYKVVLELEKLIGLKS